MGGGVVRLGVVVKGAPVVRFRCRPTPRVPPIARNRSRASGHPGVLTSTETDDTTPAACASRMPRFTPAEKPKSSAFTTRRRSSGVAPPPVVPADLHEVAEHPGRVGREPHGARLVVVAVMHRHLLHPEAMLARDAEHLHGEAEARNSGPAQ